VLRKNRLEKIEKKNLMGGGGIHPPLYARGLTYFVFFDSSIVAMNSRNTEKTDYCGRADKNHLEASLFGW